MFTQRVLPCKQFILLTCIFTILKTGCCSNGLKGLSSLKPDNTTELTFWGTVSPTLDGAPFSRFTQLIYLDLHRNKIRFVDSSAFQGLNELQELRLNDNSIASLEPDVFKHCPKLLGLVLDDNSITDINTVFKAIERLTNLKSLSIDDNPLKTIDKPSPALKFLTHLSVTACELETIVKSAFAPLRNLQVLDLSENRLTENQLADALTNVSGTLRKLYLREMDTFKKIPTNALIQLSSTEISELSFSAESFHAIRREDFPYLPSLSVLGMRYCAIRKIELGAFDNLPQLQELDLSYNYLMTLFIPNAKMLKILDLSYNFDPVTIEEKQFLNFTQLEVLNLNEVKINEIPRFAFDGLSNLQELHLRGCNLSTLANYVFENLSALKTLDISGNIMVQLTIDSFFGLGNLAQLFLSNNRLKAIEFNFGQVTPHLAVLDIQRNNMTTVPDLKLLENLETLSLDNNYILPWKKQILTNGTSNLKLISLNRNSLSTVTPDMLKDFGQIPTVNVSFNPFDCNCELVDFAIWLGSNQTSITNLDQITCSAPKDFNGQMISVLSVNVLCVSKDVQQIIIIGSVTGIILLGLLAGIVTCYYFRWYLRYWWLVVRSKARRAKGLNDDDKFRYDAFVSYNEHDRQWIVDHLVPNLENDEPRLHLCLHERNFEVGKAILQNIVDSIDMSHKIILVLSNNFVESQWCTWEMNMAQFKLVDDKREALVLVMLEKIEKNKMSSTLRYLIRTRTYIEWTDNPQGHRHFWARLKRTIRAPEEQVERRQRVA